MPVPTPDSKFSKIVDGVIRNVCPHCFKEKVFNLAFLMKPNCAGCGYRFEREPGYFMGAMVFSYILGAFSTVPTLVIGLKILEQPMVQVILIASLQIMLLAPVLFKYSRLIWMHLDYRADPAR